MTPSPFKDLHQYPLNRYLINNIEDIVVLLAWKVLSTIVSAAIKRQVTS